MAARPISTIKELVSKRRKRYTQDGFNLDLAYITPNVIAMGFPADKLEGVYRNHIDDVKRFLEWKHKNQYKVYNLCSERKYDLCRFERVERYPFDDHNPPKIQLIKDFCDDVHKWLSADEKNVAAVHCKAGKGRTGTMICCYLLYSGQFKTAADALNHYAQKRTHDEKGVTIPSQRRYVEYYSYLLKSGKLYNPIALQICEIKLSPPPIINSHQGTISYSISTSSSKKHCAQGPQFNKQDSCVTIRLDVCIPLDGDINVEFFLNKMLRKQDKLFHFWFNTFFVDELATVLPNGNLSYKLKKHELDTAHKDMKEHKIYSKDFEVEVIMQKITRGPFSTPRSTVTDNNTTNQNNYNSNHHILTPQNNLPTNGQSLYHNNASQYRHQNNIAYNNHHLAHRGGPPAIAVGGPCSTGGYDQVDNATAPRSVMTNSLGGDMQIPSEASETSSSSEPSSSSEEWESGECCDMIISRNNSSKAISSCNEIAQAMINNQLECGVKTISSCSNNVSDNVVVEFDDHDNNQDDADSATMIHLDFAEDKKKSANHYNDDNYYLGTGHSLVTASAIPISASKPHESKSENLSQSPSNTPPFIKILAQRKKFKAKTAGATASTTPTGKKIRWLANMKSDPDFRETLNKNVHFRPTQTTTGLSPLRTSNDSLNSDYYSSICDKQLSFGSPAKSPSDFIRLAKVHEHRVSNECPDIVVATKKKITQEFTPPPPNTPTTPGESSTSIFAAAKTTEDDDSRKSFKRFFNFARKEHDTSPIPTPQPTQEIPIIKITNNDESAATTNTKASSNSKFSFRDLRNEIQSAIKMHQTNNDNNHNNNKSNGDSKKSKKV